jgi:hypothetical protein
MLQCLDTKTIPLKITQAAFSQMETVGKKLHKNTLEKLAAVLGLSLEQLQ